MSKTALVVHSGGMDSTTVLYLACSRFGRNNVRAIGFDYGQRHKKELEQARVICDLISVPYQILMMPNWAEGASALTFGGEVPEGHYAHPTMKQTVVPNRNSIMLNTAVGVGMAMGVSVVYTGVHAGDHPVYPDCRPEFLDRLNELIMTGNEGFDPPMVEAPFIRLDKADIAGIGHSLDVPWELTWSCYKGGDFHCGRCSTCIERLEALNSFHDPTEYEDKEYWKEIVNV